MANLENDIDRFIIAQDNRYIGYDQALNEIRDGKKVRHWIGYIFPQLRVLLEHSDKTIVEILGHIDSMKVQSSMTLFDCVVPNSLFAGVLQTFYNGEKDRQSIV